MLDSAPSSRRMHHINFLSSDSDEENQLCLKNYADEKERQQWHCDWPDDPIPPYDRDRKLPKAPRE